MKKSETEKIPARQTNDLLSRKNFFWKAIATFGGAGYSPVAPGTVGAIFAVVPAFFILRYTVLPELWIIQVIIVFTILGVAASNRLEKEWGHDPQRIVVDEAVGMWISLLFIPYGLLNMLFAFILFRFFDIFKPLGINRAQSLRGGFGVMADDVLAGIAANITLRIVLFIINQYR